MLEPFHVELLRVARTRAHSARGACGRASLRISCRSAQVVILILPVYAGVAQAHRRNAACSHAAGRSPGERSARAYCGYGCAGRSAQCGPHSRCARRHRSRAAARWASTVELPQPADHAARRRLQLRSSRRAPCTRRWRNCAATSPASRCTTWCKPQSDLLPRSRAANRASPARQARPDPPRARLSATDPCTAYSPMYTPSIDDPQPPVGGVFACLPPAGHQAIAGQGRIQVRQRRAQAHHQPSQRKRAYRARCQARNPSLHAQRNHADFALFAHARATSATIRTA